MNEKLLGKRALVTGGGTRIGRALALRLAKEGCDVLVHYSSSAQGAEEVVQSIRKIGRQSESFQADFSTKEGPLALAEECGQRFPSLDILVNNASWWPEPESLSAKHDLLGETFENWERTMAVNARAPFFLTQALFPLLEKSLDAAIVNIVDQSISEPFLDRASHSVSKSALAAITKLSAMELCGRVRVNAIELGAILPPPGMPESEQRKREWGGTRSVEDAVIFVLTSQFVNGEIIPVRGNRHLQGRGDLENL